MCERRKLTCSRRNRQALSLLALIAMALPGCAALTNPVADSLPVRRLPPEILGESREGKLTIPLNWLGQKPPEVYRIGKGDVLGVWVAGVLGLETQNPPVYFPSQVNFVARRLPPAVGFPVPVRQDGTIVLPMLDPLSVQGMTVAEAQEAVRQAYLRKSIIRPDRAVTVTIMEQRPQRVLVIRQEAGGFTSGGVGGIIASSTKRGTGHVLDLAPNENDVLTALAQTGGLPGLDAYNEVVIFRGGQSRPDLITGLQALQPGCNPLPLAGPSPVVQIPLRMPPGATPPFRPEDVLLSDGDVVFIEARDREVFYAGGLLPAGEYVIPRDYDLTVVRAIALIKGPLVNGAFGGNTLSGALLPSGTGGPSPSLVTVLRKVPGCGQIAIRVDLNKALRDPRENIIIQPQDVVILQEKPGEALARYFTQTLFNFSFTWEAIRSRFATGVIDVSAPQQIPGRIGVSTVTTNNTTGTTIVTPGTP